jgi:hypothetical protein
MLVLIYLQTIGTGDCFIFDFNYKLFLNFDTLSGTFFTFRTKTCNDLDMGNTPVLIVVAKSNTKR